MNANCMNHKSYFLKLRMPEGRLYLCPEEPVKSESVVKAIHANTWCEARQQTRMNGLEAYRRVAGHGFYS